MAQRFLTSADVVATITITGLYPVPQQLQEFAVEDIFGVDKVTRAEAVMGADGKAAFGYIPSLKKITFKFMATSKSLDIFEALAGAEDVAKKVYRIDGTILIPALGKSYTLTNGTMTASNIMPDAKKTLQSQDVELTFESILPALI
jgi:hypothetical protein